MIDQSMETTEVQLGELMNFIGVTYRTKKDSQTTASPKPTPSMVTGHKTGNLEHTSQPTGISSG